MDAGSYAIRSAAPSKPIELIVISSKPVFIKLLMSILKCFDTLLMDSNICIRHTHPRVKIAKKKVQHETLSAAISASD